MPEVHELSRVDARRVAVRAQLLTARRPRDIDEVARGLAVLTIDPVSAVAPSADLVLWSRLGSAYDPSELEDAVAGQRLVELDGRLRPAEDVALFRAEMDAWPGAGDLTDWQVANEQWLRDNDACRLDVLERLRADGPLPLRDLPDTCVRPWRSSGWNDHKNVPMLLGLLVARGEVAVAGREGREKLWDLAERVYPDDPYPPLEDALPARDERVLGTLGIARWRGPRQPGVPAVVDGVRGRWRVAEAWAALLDEPFEGRAALLSPFDRTVADRRRLADLFEFEYYVEMYKPASQRRWGYYALPVLHGDRFVGKLDVTADRREGELAVNAVHADEPWTEATTDAVDAEIDDLARWLRLEVVRLDRA